MDLGALRRLLPGGRPAAPSSGGAGAEHGPAPIVARDAAWRRLPPIERTVGEPPLVARSRGYEQELAAGREMPTGLQRLGHEVGLHAPAGIVTGIAAPAARRDEVAPGSVRPVQRRSAASSAPAMRRTVSRAGAAGDGPPLQRASTEEGAPIESADAADAAPAPITQRSVEPLIVARMAESTPAGLVGALAVARATGDDLVAASPVALAAKPADVPVRPLPHVARDRDPSAASGPPTVARSAEPGPVAVAGPPSASRRRIRIGAPLDPSADLRTPAGTATPPAHAAPIAPLAASSTPAGTPSPGAASPSVSRPPATAAVPLRPAAVAVARSVAPLAGRLQPAFDLGRATVARSAEPAETGMDALVGAGLTTSPTVLREPADAARASIPGLDRHAPPAMDDDGPAIGPALLAWSAPGGGPAAPSGPVAGSPDAIQRSAARSPGSATAQRAAVDVARQAEAWPGAWHVRGGTAGRSVLRLGSARADGPGASPGAAPGEAGTADASALARELALPEAPTGGMAWTPATGFTSAAAVQRAPAEQPGGGPSAGGPTGGEPPSSATGSGSAGPAAAGAAGGTTPAGGSATIAALGTRELDELARRLYDPIRQRIARELVVDRERAGVQFDLR